MAEWLKASVLKTDSPQGLAGSNPALPAILLARAAHDPVERGACRRAASPIRRDVPEPPLSYLLP